MKLQQITENLRLRLGIDSLTPVQQRMATLVDNPTVVLTAPTGSGKTVAFALNLLLSMKKGNETTPRSLVIAPTRELALQIGEVVRAAADGQFRLTVCYGGHPFAEEERSLAAGADIVVGTPGRLLDHSNRSTLDPARVATLVIDEYDKALELGFEQDMKRIVRRLKSLRHTVVTSATHLALWPEWLPGRDRIEIDTTVGDGNSDPDPRAKTDIYRIDCYTRDKLPLLEDLLFTLPRGRTIIFVNHRESAERLHESLCRDGFTATMFHGGIEQRDRENALELFANGSANILVATDLAARGLDIDDVANIVHYHIPPTAESWTHRNGRTARMGASGNIYLIVRDDETLPEYVEWDRNYIPNPEGLSPEPAPNRTIWFNLGKKEKISRGDIVGFLNANAPSTAGRVGRIALRDHSSLAAIPADEADAILARCGGAKLKGQRVRMSILKL
ncbi:MAG: DEAD/DEAH box helicase [Clostridium sp.]|nr:DEAD/DEAH box helicase [Clostridium sp.]